MSRVEKVAIHDFINGEVVQDVTLDSVVELLRIAGNDTYDRVIKQYQIITAAGAVKTTQNLDTVINTLKLKESANITLVLDTATSTVTINASGVVTTATLDFHKTSSDHDNRYYTEAEMDTKLGLVATGNPPDRSIPGIKLVANTVTEAELAATYARGVASGVATLGVDGKVPTGQLPANQLSTADALEVRTLRLRSMFK